MTARERNNLRAAIGLMRQHDGNCAEAWKILCELGGYQHPLPLPPFETAMREDEATSVGELSLPWPRKGDSLVTSAGDRDAVARTLSGKQLEPYVVAYKMAADILVEEIRGDTLRLNLLVFPIVFLYRHHLELRLKSIIYDNVALDGTSTASEKDHRLLPLWRACRPIVEKWWINCPKTDLDAVEDTLTEFDSLDRTSQAARYPTTVGNRGSSSLLGVAINIKHFAGTVAKTSGFLDAVSDQFAEMENNRW